MFMPIAALFALGSPAVTPAAMRPALQIVVHDETASTVPAATLRDAFKEARAIWHSYVDLDFVSGAEVGKTVTDDVLTLVITDRLSGGGAEGSLGWIDFVDGEPSKTITVSHRSAILLRDQAAWAGRPLTAWPAAVRDMFLVRALGRSIAHEIGHYLLRSKAHEASGLMRARFDAAALMEHKPDQFRLLETDLRQLQRRFSSYLLARRGPPATAVQ
jgi:hypothetical protein